MIALPNELKILITFLITQGIKAVFGLFSKDLSGVGAAITAILVGAVIVFIEGVLNLFPESQEIVSAVLGFLAVVLGSFGTHYTYRNIGV